MDDRAKNHSFRTRDGINCPEIAPRVTTDNGEAPARRIEQKQHRFLP